MKEASKKQKQPAGKGKLFRQKVDAGKKYTERAERCVDKVKHGTGTLLLKSENPDKA